MNTEHSPEHASACCSLVHGALELLTEEQKKKIAIMKIDIEIQWMEKKIRDMEGAIEVKKKMVANMRQVQEMIKSNK
jgi:hypothetical protein